MITSIELGNFLSHSSTKLDFDAGVTVFVGPNGAGKSSIIDGITFALFGQHTRKSNKGLIRRGENQGYSKINFTVKGRNYQAVRKIDTKGVLSAQFLEREDQKTTPIAAGERKQFGESMTREIESTIGLDFDKLRIASIVQQGELNSIIKARPKEFKELLNAVIGIDKLDRASELMRTIQNNFRYSIQKNLGDDDTHIEIRKKDLKKIEEGLAKAMLQKNAFVIQRENCKKELDEMQNKIEKELPKREKLNELQTRKDELIKYARNAILSIKQDITQKERKIRDCQGCFAYAKAKTQTESRLKEIESTLESITKKIQENRIKLVKLQEQKALASKLKLHDDKCPVCGSIVDHLNPFFQVEHLQLESDTIEQQNKSLDKQKDHHNQEKNDFSKKRDKSIEAQETLRVHSVQNMDELDLIKKEIITQKNYIQKIPPTPTFGNLVEVASIDSHTKILYEKIFELEQETKGFDPKEFTKLKNLVDDKRQQQSVIDQRLGAVLEKIGNDQLQIKEITKLLQELELAKLYLAQLDEIREKIFSRDGIVATSLRSWALQTISTKASQYLSRLNTKIQRISLSEKTREVSITGYSKNMSFDLDSLSGGEQVSVALSLRLAMAYLVGSSNLNIVILDEPTIHLDEQRRKSLVSVLSELSNITNTIQKTATPLQFIIITHDSEIFEDSAVEKIYKFEWTDQGTKVVAL